MCGSQFNMWCEQHPEQIYIADKVRSGRNGGGDVRNSVAEPRTGEPKLNSFSGTGVEMINSGSESFLFIRLEKIL